MIKDLKIKWLGETLSAELHLDDIYVELDSESTDITNGTFDLTTTGKLYATAMIAWESLIGDNIAMEVDGSGHGLLTASSGDIIIGDNLTIGLGETGIDYSTFYAFVCQHHRCL